MKQLTLLLILAVMYAGTTYADGVGVTIRLGHPNFFGEIELGNTVAPRVVRENPILIQRSRHGMRMAPIYLRVPPNQIRNWRRYCVRYNACSRPVYFVRDDWYQNEYVPQYRERHHDRDRDGDRNRNGDGEDRRDERHNEEGNEDRGYQRHGDQHDHDNNGDDDHRRDR